MSNVENRKVVIDYWWEKAEQSMGSAERELESGALSFAINRLYYALFYAVSAALFAQGKTFKKHAGVRAEFHKEFIKTGKMDIHLGKLYDQLFSDRQEGDYVAFVEFETEYVQQKLDNCKEFFVGIKEYIKELDSKNE